jgi:hypothetical protein
LTHPIGTLGLFTLVWPWSSAAATTSPWQDWAPAAPDELWSNCLLVADQSTPAGEAPAARVTGVYVGSQAALQTLVDELVSEVGASPFTTFVGSATYLDTMLIEGGCADDSVNECHLPSQNPVGLLDRAPFVAKSNIVDSKLSAAGIATLLDAAGGAINRVAPDATAYVHRRSLAMLQYSASWVDSSPPSVVAANRQWIETAWRLMRPYVSSGACSNYADPDLVDWEQAYWGSNFTKLTEVKRAYDPGNVFHFPQSIPLG